MTRNRPRESWIVGLLRGVRGILLAALVLAAIDTVLLAELGREMSWWIPTAISLLTGLFGVLVILYGVHRLNGTLAELGSYRLGEGTEDLREESAYAEKFSIGGLIVLAGVLLLLPGPITDLLGISLFIPAVQRRVIKVVAPSRP
jgi:UPF0716 protein FxsA